MLGMSAGGSDTVLKKPLSAATGSTLLAASLSDSTVKVTRNAQIAAAILDDESGSDGGSVSGTIIGVKRKPIPPQFFVQPPATEENDNGTVRITRTATSPASSSSSSSSPALLVTDVDQTLLPLPRSPKSPKSPLSPEVAAKLTSTLLPGVARAALELLAAGNDELDFDQTLLPRTPSPAVPSAAAGEEASGGSAEPVQQQHHHERYEMLNGHSVALPPILLAKLSATSSTSAASTPTTTPLPTPTSDEIAEAAALAERADAKAKARHSLYIQKPPQDDDNEDDIMKLATALLADDTNDDLTDEKLAERLREMAALAIEEDQHVASLVDELEDSDLLES